MQMGKISVASDFQEEMSDDPQPTSAGSWCILRTAGSRTLALAVSLSDAGFEVWTPKETREIRFGKKRELIEREMPILSEWVFAQMSDLTELLNMSRTSGLPYRVWDKEVRRMVLRSYPKFEVFKMHGRIQPQSNHSLAPLRALEASLDMAAERRRNKARSKGPAPRFHAGQTVHVDGSGFEGLPLTVAEDNLGRIVRLSHPDWPWIVEISAFKIRGVHVSGSSPEPGNAEIAA